MDNKNIWKLPQRYVLGVMCLLALIIAYTQRLCLSMAITEIVGSNVSSMEYTVNISSNSEPSSSGHFLWDEATQGLILSAFFWGYCVTYLPCGLITQNIGGKIMISAGILASSVCTLLIPIIVETYGAVGITILRFIIGLSQGPMFPGFNVLLSQWAPKKERGRLGAIVFAGSYLGSAISLTLSGIIIYSWSWKTVFYIFGSIGLIWLIFWQFICYEQPSHHPFISETELSYLNEEITKAKQKDIPPVPWKSILTSLPLWSLVIVQFGHDWGLFTVVADLPKYMRGVIHFSVTENGLLSSAPYLVMWLFAVACGWTIDWLVKEKNIDLTTVHKIFGTIGAIGPAAGIVGASYCGGHKTLVATLFAVAFGLMGAYVPSVWLGTLALNPNYAGTVTSLVGGIGSTSGVFAPYVVGILTPNNSLIEWRTAFWVAAVILVVTNAFYILFGSTELQPWDQRRKHSNDTVEDKKMGDQAI